jgi:hypothetical protein
MPRVTGSRQQLLKIIFIQQVSDPYKIVSPSAYRKPALPFKMAYPSMLRYFEGDALEEKKER